MLNVRRREQELRIAQVEKVANAVGMNTTGNALKLVQEFKRNSFRDRVRALENGWSHAVAKTATELMLNNGISDNLYDAAEYLPKEAAR